MQSTAKAVWQGGLKDGKGSLNVGSGELQADYSFAKRFENKPGTNPEELIGAAHAGCYSMALSMLLGEAGYPPQEIATTANVRLEEVDGDFEITTIELKTQAKVPGISAEDFQKQAEAAKVGCPVSKALAGPQIKLVAELQA